VAYFIEVPLEGGGTIRVEADAPDGIVPAGRPREVAARANATLQETLDRLAPVTEKLRAVLSKLQDAPDKVTVEFGVKLSAEAGIVVAKGTSEANFAIRLEWGDAES
jgi:hypothetical protein